MRFLIGHERLRRVEFNFLSLVNDENLVALNNCIQSVSDGHHCSSCKFLSNELLDRLFCDYVDIGSSLIEDHNLVLTKDGSADADQLFLSNTEVVSVLGNLVVEACVAEIFLGEEPVLVLDLFLSPLVLLLFLGVISILGEELLKASLLYEFFDTLIADLVEWVEVVAKRAREEGWVLWDLGDLFSYSL